MGFLLSKSKLLSRKLRVNQVAQNFDDLLGDTSATDTVRKISSAIKFVDETDTEGNIIDRIFNIAKGTFGLISGLIKTISISASYIVGALRASYNFIINFDFNASDTALKAQINNNNLVLSATWGGFVGEVLGTGSALLAGYGLTVAIGGAINTFIPIAGAVLTKELAKGVLLETLGERIPELIDSLKFAIKNSASLLAKNSAINSFITLRNILKRVFPDNERIQRWGEGERWTIAEAFEETIEQVTGNELIDVAIEEGAEEFEEAFWETGFLFARNLDDAREQAKINKEQILGQNIPETTIELDPDSNEKIVIPDQPTLLAKQQILTEISQFRRIRNRDIGFFTGEPTKEESRRFNFLRTGKVVFRGVQKPPFGTSKLSSITLKDLKPNLKWRDFKQALKPHNWGPHFVWITLNKSRHEMGAWFSTIPEGESYLKNLVALIIDDDYIAIDSKTEVERNRFVRKSNDVQLMYPTALTITIKTPVTSREDATHDLAGNSFIKEPNKIILWTDNEPPFTGNDNGFIT